MLTFFTMNSLLFWINSSGMHFYFEKNGFLLLLKHPEISAQIETFHLLLVKIVLQADLK